VERFGLLADTNELLSVSTTSLIFLELLLNADFSTSGATAA